MPQADNFPAMLKTGEYVLRKEAVDEIGKDKLDMMNNVDRLGYVSGGLVPEGSNGHSAIDELLALNTLSSQRNVDMTRDTGMYDEGGMAYIDPSDSTIVTKNSEQSKLFNMLKNSIAFAPGTTNKDALETIVDMLNNPNRDNALDKDKDRTPIRSLPPERIEFNDPLEINARQMMGAQGDIGGIGMRDTTSLKSILNDLNRMQLDYKTMERQRSRYPDEKSFKDYKENRVEAGDSMGLEEIVRILSRAAGATQQMPNVKGYGNGGETYSYGTGSTEMPTLEDVYDETGVMIADPSQRLKFENRYTYDPSEEETTIADYQSNVKGVRTGAASALEKNRAAASSAGGGFSGFGERERMISDSSSDIYQKGNRALSDSSRGLYDSIKGMREDYLANAVSALDLIDEGDKEEVNNAFLPTSDWIDRNMQAMIDMINSNQPELTQSNQTGIETFNAQPPTYNPGGRGASGSTAVGADGKTYVWNGRSWDLQR